MFTLTFNTLTVNLPSPEFDDSYDRKYRRIVRESRGKELLLFPKLGYTYLNRYDSYSYHFTFLSELLKQQLITFLDTAIGQVVTVTDYNSDTYQGLITTPSTEIINSARNNNEFNLEIERVG